MYNPLTPRHIAELAGIVGSGHVLVEDEKLLNYRSDATDIDYPPEALVAPANAGEVSELVRFAVRERIPVTPRGTGTGLSGGALPVLGGLLLSMHRFDRILEIDPLNLLGVVEPGVFNLDYQKAAAEQGLFYPPDPASYETCSLGGNVAEDAGGPHCFKYGTTRNYILQLEVVLPDGSLETVGVRTRKGVVGYDLKDLIIGAEGTLGIVTKIVTRLIPKPAHHRLLLAYMPDIGSSALAVQKFVLASIIPSSMEFMDDSCIGFARRYQGLSVPETVGTLLIIELDGNDPDRIDSEMEQVGGILLQAGADDVLVADNRARQDEIWNIRRQMSTTIKEHVGIKVAEDVVVPISALPQFLERTRRLEKQYDLKVIHYGHLGDGNVHTNVVHEDSGPEVRERIHRAIGEIFRIVLELGGSISGEHGVGITKQPWFDLEISPRLSQLQQSIREQFDPHGIMNPGKIFTNRLQTDFLKREQI